MSLILGLMIVLFNCFQLSDEGEFYYVPDIVKVHDPEILQVSRSLTP